MKKSSNVLGTLIVVFCISAAVCLYSAPREACSHQNAHKSHKNLANHNGVAKEMNLTKEQKELHNKMMKLHELFVGSLTEEQSRLMKLGASHGSNKYHGATLDHDEIAKSINLSKEQQELHNKIMELHAAGNEKEMMRLHELFLNSLTEKQKETIEKHGHH